MATATIRRTWTVNGVLTDVTTALLSDPTGAYGLKRNDTNAVVVADGTAMTRESTGTYSYTFTDLTDGIAHTAFVEFVHSGKTYHFEHDIEATTSVSAASLAVTYTSLQADIAHYLGYSSTSSDWTADQQARITAAIRSGLRRFYWPPVPEGQPDIEWNFLRKKGTITLAAATGTYSLASDFAFLVADPVSAVGRVQRLSPDLMAALNAANSATGAPKYCAVYPQSPDATTGSRYELVVRPTPQSNYDTLSYRYVCEPPMLDGTNQHPLGGVAHAETIREACLAAAESGVNDSSHVHEERFQKALAASVRLDIGAKHVLSS